jgi:hypothetical protein
VTSVHLAGPVSLALITSSHTTIPASPLASLSSSATDWICARVDPLVTDLDYAACYSLQFLRTVKLLRRRSSAWLVLSRFLSKIFLDDDFHDSQRLASLGSSRGRH